MVTVSQLFPLLISQEDWTDVEGEEKDNVDSTGDWRDLRTADRLTLLRGREMSYNISSVVLRLS